ncbi:MAG: HNH endonuclease [Calditrichaeota bacterium]|nr:MAG: HNH endonuclease [Calditrichota bacterium]MBL1205683.1 HNH endonuclease [Calditrichota bacterium]NOG45511.1 HNH endonuclease [Calditrichota bacterium]
MNKPWTREELILTINLYCKLPFGKLHKSTSEVIGLSQILKRTPSAIAWKLVNFASFDENLKKRGIKGAKNTSKLDKEIWDEFNNNWEELSFESEKKNYEMKKENIDSVFMDDDERMLKGIDKKRIIKTRVNQSFFRKTVLASYNNKCCITGIDSISLLIASHIKPWSLDKKNRLNPRNGLALNSLHDKAFDIGLLSITPNYKIKISNELKNKKPTSVLKEYFLNYDGKEITLPTRFLPDPELLEYHYEKCFVK